MPQFSISLEQLAKQINDPQFIKCNAKGYYCNSKRLEEVEGAIIVGAGPSGMASAVCLKMEGIPSIVIEKEECIASLWKNKTYDRLKLHIAKEYCQLPFMPFPESYPTFVSRDQFLDYLDRYAQQFQIQPRFCQVVESARFCENSQRWHVLCSGRYDHTDLPNAVEFKEYIGKWLVVATGENAEVVRPHISGIESFKGTVIHSSEYKNGFEYEYKKVLVVGCGNSGMEIALDLVNYNARPSLVVRSSVHVLPRQMMGKSTFGLAMKLMKLFPVRIVDRLLLLYSKFTLGNTASYGLSRPVEGPLELKSKTGKTPVLDVGTVAKIRAGDIKVFPNIKGITATGVQFEDGHTEDYDVIILATGYRSDVPRWLKDDGGFFSEEGLPKAPFPNNWKAVGKKGLYAAGLSRRGLLGSSIDAQLIARDIKEGYNNCVNNSVRS